MSLFEDEAYGEDEITCPWCQEPVTTDSWEWADYSDDEECPHCGKRFFYERDIEVTYNSKRIEEKDE